jgi:hypothetical protein
LIRVTFDWTKPLLALLILSNSNGFVIWNRYFTQPKRYNVNGLTQLLVLFS